MPDPIYATLAMNPENRGSVELLAYSESMEHARDSFAYAVKHKVSDRIWVMPWKSLDAPHIGVLTREQRDYDLGDPILYAGLDTDWQIHDFSAPSAPKRRQIVIVIDCDIPDTVLDRGYTPSIPAQGGEGYLRKAIPEFIEWAVSEDYEEGSYKLSNPKVFLSAEEFNNSRQKQIDWDSPV